MMLTGDDTNASYDESSGKTLQKMVTLQRMSAKGKAAGVVQCLVVERPGATKCYNRLIHSERLNTNAALYCVRSVISCN